MKLNRTHLFIGISSLALLIVLLIQVNWIIETARIKEELFNEKANIILARTTEAISLDPSMRKSFESGLGRQEMQRIDSLLSFYMRFYNFHIDYLFELKQGSVIQQNATDLKNLSQPNQQACFQKNLEEVANNSGFELKLVFPEKEAFIMAEMGLLFITSVLLLVIVMVLLWRTTASLLKEKEISEHTTDFLNNMTHEFKTPLTNIALAGKMIQKEGNGLQAAKIKHYSGIILDENEKLRLQVEQVLSMTALERGEIPLIKTTVDLHILLSECSKNMALQLEHRQGKLTLNLKAVNFMIKGDKTHLTNAICNLIDNAIKYSGENPEILIQTYDAEKKIFIVVTDKGIGIEKEHQELVFNKFFRVPTGDVHDVKGFGLGLAYVKKIIELHRGSIVLNSEKMMGTTFMIELPNG